MSKQSHKEFIIIETTYPDLVKAQNLSEILLQKKLAACVQFSAIESSYFWQGKIEKSAEILVSIKTKKFFFQQIEKIIKKHHDYEVPQIISIQIECVSNGYLNWLELALKK